MPVSVLPTGTVLESTCGMGLFVNHLLISVGIVKLEGLCVDIFYASFGRLLRSICQMELFLVPRLLSLVSASQMGT